MTVQLSPAYISANGTSTTTATATVTDASGNSADDDTVVFTSNDAGEQITQPAPGGNGDGTYTATIQSSTTPGPVTITATDTSMTPNVSGTATLTQYGPAANVSVQLSPALISASGGSTTATATVTDSSGDPVPGDTVSYSSTDPGEGSSTFTDNGDGTYTAQITHASQQGQQTITATDTSVTPNSPQGTATLTQYGPATNVSVQLSPALISASGGSTTATATVTDSSGDPVPGDTVSYSSTDSGEGSGTFTDNGDGTYTAQIAGASQKGQQTITATDTSVTPSSPQGTATLTQYGPAANVAVQLNPSTIVANGTSTTTATATVTDSRGDPVPTDTVTFRSSDVGNHISSTTNNGDGTYTATITSSTTAQTATVTATDGGLSNQAILTETPGPATSITLQLLPGTIVANGSSTTTAIATVADAYGNRVSGDPVTFASSDPGEGVGATVNDGDGVYTATIRSSTTVGKATITAADGALSATGTLTQTVVPAGSVSVTLTRGAIRANGISRTIATATVLDAQGHPLREQHVSFSSTDPGEGIVEPASGGNGDGTYTATIISSTRAQSALITATDLSANPTRSGAVALIELPARSLAGLVRAKWTFFFTPSYTHVLAFFLRVPAWTSVRVTCRGHGCPFTRRTVAVTNARRVDLTRGLSRSVLRPGARVTIEVLRTGWIGKYYGFLVRSGRGPRARVSCLAPWEQRPGVGCRP